MRVVIVGSAGQIGSELMRAPIPAGWQRADLGRAELDITDERAVAAALAACRPDLVINAAAYTAVDRAESDRDNAVAVNATGPAILARRCAAIGAALIHYSTDYVFDGAKAAPYREADPVNPLGVYGASKEAGERAVRATLARHVILRTSWVYGTEGGNFVKTMIRLAGERPELSVVADQFGCPTAAADIAEATIEVATAIAAGRASWGTFHYAGTGATSWHGFATAIIGEAAKRSGRRPDVRPISSADYPTPARRPANSVLDCAAIAGAYGIHGKPWPQSLSRIIDSILHDAEIRRGS
jgi:dTDP-4-dehydrorhamnose reductase